MPTAEFHSTYRTNSMASACASSVTGDSPVTEGPWGRCRWMRSKAKRTGMGCCRCTPAWLYVYACFALVLLVLGFRPWPPRDLLLVEARAIGRSRTTHVGDCRRVPVLATGPTGGECVAGQGRAWWWMEME